MGGLGIRKNDTDARARPRCRTLRNYVNRLSRKLGESALIYMAALQVLFYVYTLRYCVRNDRDNCSREWTFPLRHIPRSFLPPGL